MEYKLLRLPTTIFGNQIFSTIGDDQKNYIICPCCKSKIKLSQYEDSRGFHVEPLIRCPECGSGWSILLYRNRLGV